MKDKVEESNALISTICGPHSHSLQTLFYILCGTYADLIIFRDIDVTLSLPLGRV
jgi:hypothetical protein